MDPNIILLAGPNGAGKSTAAPDLLQDALHVDEFVNADVIPRGLSAFHPEGAALEAGRVMLSRLKELAGEKHRLRIHVGEPHIRPVDSRLAEDGVSFPPVLFLAHDTRNVHKSRAKAQDTGWPYRAAETIHRCYHAGIRNFFELYAPIAINWQFFDNTLKPRTLIASGGQDLEEQIANADIWARLKKEYQYVGNGDGSKTITESIRDGVTVNEALDRAFYRAVLLHRQANVPMTVTENGKMAEVDANTIPIPEKYADLEPFRY